MGAVILQTPRLLLRPWEESDAPRLFALCRDEAIGPAAGWPAHRSEEESLEAIRGVLSAPETWAVVLKEENAVAGCVGLKTTAAVPEKEWELGYWVGRDYWGRGLIPEACEAVLERCFITLGAQRVWCGHYEGNTKSRRVIEKCGFTPVVSKKEIVTLIHEERLCHYYALTAEDWRRAREETK